MQDSLNNFLTSTPYAYALFSFAVWCCVCSLISLLSGWFALSRRFPRQSEPYGVTRRVGPWFGTVYTRFWGHYSGVMRLVAAEDALYLSVLFPFRIGHPPLRIPWNEIRLSRSKRFWVNYVILTLGLEEQIPFRISERMAKKLGLLKRVPAKIDVPGEANFDTLSDEFIGSQRQKPG